MVWAGSGFESQDHCQEPFLILLQMKCECAKSVCKDGMQEISRSAGSSQVNSFKPKEQLQLYAINVNVVDCCWHQHNLSMTVALAWKTTNARRTSANSSSSASILAWKKQERHCWNQNSPLGKWLAVCLCHTLSLRARIAAGWLQEIYRKNDNHQPVEKQNESMCHEFSHTQRNSQDCRRLRLRMFLPGPTVRLRRKGRTVNSPWKTPCK